MRQSWCESYRSGPETEVSVPRRALYGFDPTRLTEVRRERGLSRSDLGRLSGVTYNTIRSWETGEGAPSPSALERVASVLDVAVSELAVVPDEVQTLASWRTRQGMAQADIAHELGLSKSTYSRLERGERPLTDAECLKLARIFDTTEEQVRALWMRAHRRSGGPTR